jgi:hypothetical protein
VVSATDPHGRILGFRNRPAEQYPLNLNWFMHPVARVSINKYRNLRTQEMLVHSLVCIFFFTTCFGPYWWPSSGGLYYEISKAVTVYTMVTRLDITLAFSNC